MVGNRPVGGVRNPVWFTFISSFVCAKMPVPVRPNPAAHSELNQVNDIPVTGIQE